jgi:hypothetical protein
MKANAFAKRPMAARSIFVSFIWLVAGHTPYKLWSNHWFERRSRYRNCDKAVETAALVNLCLTSCNFPCGGEENPGEKHFQECYWGQADGQTTERRVDDRSEARISANDSLDALECAIMSAARGVPARSSSRAGATQSGKRHSYRGVSTWRNALRRRPARTPSDRPPSHITGHADGAEISYRLHLTLEAKQGRWLRPRDDRPVKLLNHYGALRPWSRKRSACRKQRRQASWAKSASRDHW